MQNLKTIKSISQLYNIMSDTKNKSDADKHKVLDQRLRFYLVSNIGIIKPDNWDELSATEKQRRLDKMESVI
tara:strand:+ start:521 stop:736 length:216 start_codon:yes stop_codon:yes gene_type:complete